jgi:hypothetical protein
MVYRGTSTLPRLNAHRAVLAAAALTTLVAAALATTLVVFSGQALPRSVRQGLSAASGTPAFPRRWRAPAWRCSSRQDPRPAWPGGSAA